MPEQHVVLQVTMSGVSAYQIVEDNDKPNKPYLQRFDSEPLAWDYVRADLTEDYEAICDEVDTTLEKYLDDEMSEVLVVPINDPLAVAVIKELETQS